MRVHRIKTKKKIQIDRSPSIRSESKKIAFWTNFWFPKIQKTVRHSHFLIHSKTSIIRNPSSRQPQLFDILFSLPFSRAREVSFVNSTRLMRHTDPQTYPVKQRYTFLSRTNQIGIGAYVRFRINMLFFCQTLLIRRLLVTAAGLTQTNRTSEVLLYRHR